MLVRDIPLQLSKTTADFWTDHFHFTVQPITDSETIEVQHRAHVLPVETKTFEHDDREEVCHQQ